MRLSYGIGWALLSAGLAISPMFAQTSAATEAPQASSKSMSGMPLVAPLFIEDQQRMSVITMINSATQGVDVDVVLDSLSGDELARQTVSVSPHSEKTVAVSDLLQDRSGVQYGSIVLMPHRNTTMAAQLSIAGRNGIPANDIEEEFQMSTESKPADYRAVSVAAAPLIAVRSLSPKRELLSVTCLKEDNGSKVANGTISIEPNHTLLIDACAEEGPGVVESLQKIPAGSSAGQKGIAVSVSSPAASMDLAVFGLGRLRVPESDADTFDTGFAGIPFTGSNELKSSTAVFPGVTSLALNSTNVQAAIANFGSAPHQATVLISQGSGPASTQKMVATLQLPPHSVSLANLTDALSAVQTDSSFVIKTDGAPGEIMSGVQAIAPRNGSSADVTLPWKDVQQVPNGGQHPWRVEGGFNSTLILYNPDSGKANSVKVSVYAGNKTWMKYVDVEPLSTVTVRIDDIVRKQQPDDHGNTLPPDATSGMVGWVTLANPKVLGLLAQRDSISGIVRPFACAETYALCSISVPTAVVAIDDFTNDLSPNVSTCGTNNDCTCVESCLNGGGNLSSYDWSSDNSNIASLSSNPAYSYGQYEGIAPGGTYSAVTAFDNLSCSASGGGQVNVVKPDHLQVIGDISGTIQACPTTVYRTVHYQAVDINNALVNIPISVSEFFTNSPVTNTCNTGQPSPSPCQATDSSGAFWDTLQVGCNSVGGSCGFTLQHQWNWCKSGINLKVLSTLTDSVHNNQITVNGYTGPIPNGTQFR